MGAILYDVAAAVAAQLATSVGDEVFARPFAPGVVFDAEFALTEDGLHVDVMPAGLAIDSGTRAEFTHEVHVDVILREKLDAPGEQRDARIAFLLELEEQIARYLSADDDHGLAGRRLASMPAAVSTGPAEIRVPYVPAHLRQFGQFTGIITATYRVDQ